MSEKPKDLSGFQKDVCDVIEEIPIKNICPACEPNPNWNAPDWTQLVGKPYLNEETCEYEVCVTINKYGDPYRFSISS